MPEKILIVDDEPHIVTSLRFLMQQKGHEVAVIEDGQEALDYILAQPPRLVLLDVMLPTLDGYEVCQRIRQNPKTAHIKIIMLTAMGRSDDKEKGLELGADLYITKPFSTRQLVADVQALLEQS